MNQVRSILEDTYQLAASSDSPYFDLSESQKYWVNAIIEKAESFRGVLTVLITSLVKKIQTPTQDVRYHQDNLPNGYSGRSLDTDHITPFMKEKFRRFAMAESGWLTRSLEQPYPYTLDYEGKIRNKTVKDAFLQILNDIEKNKADPKKYLRAIFSPLITLMEGSQGHFDFLKEAQQTETVTIGKIVDLLRHHFSHDYGVAGASRLPVLAVYSAYEMLMEIQRYKGKTLLPLKSHTTADTKSRGIRAIGDIEVMHENNFFEGVEIKHNIPISLGIVEDAYQKFSQIPISRYYLLTTAEPNVEDIDSVNDLVSEIHRQHGCEVIINGIIPSLKYYLRLLSSPQLFLDGYSRNLQLDFQQKAEIKETHLRYWETLLNPSY
ncbi:MAG: DNA methyltransferase [Candidatus Poribacteria bacterium]|nr:DNA methyltransferase [Candidatus Poribacteria bacterium]